MNENGNGNEGERRTVYHFDKNMRERVEALEAAADRAEAAIESEISLKY